MVVYSLFGRETIARHILEKHAILATECFVSECLYFGAFIRFICRFN